MNTEASPWRHDTNLIDLHLQELRAGGASERTTGSRTQILTRLATDNEPGGLLYATRAELVSWLARNPKPKPGKERNRETLANYTNHIRQFFEWMHRHGHRLDNPAATVPIPKVPKRVPRVATYDQLTTALALLPQPWNRAILIAARAGARCCQLARLRREHIDQQSIRLYGKGGAVTVVPTHPAIWAAVKDLGPGPVLPAPQTGDHMTARQMAVRLREHLHRRGVMTHPHAFRGLFATQALNAPGSSTRHVQTLLGHANVNTTEGYLEIPDGQRHHIVAALPVPTGEPS